MQRSVRLSLIGGAAGAFATLLVLRATRALGRTVYLVDVGGYGAVAVGALWALVWTALAGFVVWQAHRRDVRGFWSSDGLDQVESLMLTLCSGGRLERLGARLRAHVISLPERAWVVPGTAAGTLAIPDR